jgi:hypothetical protein
VEIVNARIYALAAIFAAFGIAMAFRPAATEIHRTEEWLLNGTPLSVDGYTAQPGPDGTTQTYRMPEDTYKLLQPFGIMTRIYGEGLRHFDVVVIASNTRNSFHNPEHCFPGQFWTISDEHTVNIATRSRGTVPVTVMRASQGDRNVYAAFCFKGPKGLVASQSELYMQWSLASFLSGQPQEGAFYRFMALENDTTADQLIKFAGDYLDRVHETSRGVL